MFTLSQSLGGYEDSPNGFWSLGFSLEGLDTASKFLALFCILAVFIAGVFHLANINNAVGAVYYHVNLRPWGGLAATPRIIRGEDGVQAQGLYDFPNMIHA